MSLLLGCASLISDNVLPRVAIESCTPAQNRAAHVWWPPLCLLAFSPLGESRRFFCLWCSFWWHLQVAFYLCRRQFLHNQLPRCGEIIQTQCSRPYDTASCFLHTAIWLSKCQSILTQVQQSCEPDLYGMPQSLPFQPHDMLARRTFFAWMAAGSTRRTRSPWALTVAKRCQQWSSWKRSSWSSTSTLATRCSSTPWGARIVATVAMNYWTGYRQTVRSFSKWKLSSTPSTLALWLDPRAISTDGRHRGRSSSKEQGKNGTFKSLVEHLLCRYLDIWHSCPHLMEPPSRRQPMRCNALPLVHTMLHVLTSYVLDLRPSLASTYLGSVSSALLPGLERLPTRTNSLTALQKSAQLANATALPCSPSLRNGIVEKFLTL